MHCLLLTILPLVAVTGSDPDSYAAARREMAEMDRPLVVLVGAKWCPACVEMKQDAVPKVRRRGAMKRVAFAVVDLDQQRRLGHTLTGGGPIPQLIMFRKTPEGWRQRKLVGGQNPEMIERFIKQGVQLDDATKQAQRHTKKDAT